MPEPKRSSFDPQRLRLTTSIFKYYVKPELYLNIQNIPHSKHTVMQ